MEMGIIYEGQAEAHKSNKAKKSCATILNQDSSAHPGLNRAMLEGGLTITAAKLNEHVHNATQTDTGAPATTICLNQEWKRLHNLADKMAAQVRLHLDNKVVAFSSVLTTKQKYNDGTEKELSWITSHVTFPKYQVTTILRDDCTDWEADEFGTFERRVVKTAKAALEASYVQP